MAPAQPRRPSSRRDFEIAIICALTLEADAVDALLDHHWDDDEDFPGFDKAPGDPNAYSTGTVGRHNVVLTHMPGMGKANATAVASNCRASFPGIKLALVVGVCGVVPFDHEGREIVLGDVIVSDAVVQYDLGRRLTERFERKDTLLDSLGRPNPEIRGLLAKLRGLRGRKALRSSMARSLELLQREPELKARYPGAEADMLFEASYRHVSDGMTCDACGCDGQTVRRQRLEPEGGDTRPAVHFGLIASGDAVMRSAIGRDELALSEGVIGFEMEGAGVWDTFPCVVIKGACDYADSHKTKAWQRYAAATAAACMKAFLEHWMPPEAPIVELVGSLSISKKPAGPWFIVPFPRNEGFVGRVSVLAKLQDQPLYSSFQTRVSLFGLGGIGKTQLALEYAYWVRETHPDVSVYWVYCSNAERMRSSFVSIATECKVPGYNDPKVDILATVYDWLMRRDQGSWLMILDNADDAELFFPTTNTDDSLGQYIPECAHGSILVTTRNKQAALKLAKGKPPIELDTMNDQESQQLLRAGLGGWASGLDTQETNDLTSRLERLPLALAQAAAFMEANTMGVGEYLDMLRDSDQAVVDLLGEDFETVGRDRSAPRAVAETWMVSFEQIKKQSPLAAELLSLMSFFDRQAIPVEFLVSNSTQGLDEKGKEVWLHGIIDNYKPWISVGFSDKSKQPTAKGWSWREARVKKALGILKAFSFVTAGADLSLSVHRLVRLVTRKWLERDRRRRDSLYWHALSVATEAFPYSNLDVGVDWETAAKYLPHVSSVVGLQQRSGGASTAERLCRAVLCHKAGEFFCFRGQPREAEEYLLPAVRTVEEILGNEHVFALETKQSLAQAYFDQGEIDEAKCQQAESILLETLEISTRAFGEAHEVTIYGNGHLTMAYMAQSKLAEAEELLLRNTELCSRTFGEDSHNTLTCMGNLSIIYSWQGRWAEAQALSESVLEKGRRRFGAEHPKVYMFMENLAYLYWKRGRWEDAKELRRASLRGMQATLGFDHPRTMANLLKIAEWEAGTEKSVK
ncbi:kinesin light chain [Colletotrichum plurivorum]|uniref:Kinesin light chain n=1 Tax=Colletotrichum plurivorum TaxID=2175906 RepID=A0A8H6K0Z0_9PEZI|nr:kinesin light chain [Colletotrichum plurivorum]